MTVAYVPNHSQIMAKLNLKDSGERHNENFNIFLYVKVFQKKQADCTDINLTCGTAASSASYYYVKYYTSSLHAYLEKFSTLFVNINFIVMFFVLICYVFMFYGTQQAERHVHIKHWWMTSRSSPQPFAYLCWMSASRAQTLFGRNYQTN